MTSLVLPTLLSVIAILIALRALRYSRHQTALMETQHREQKAQEREDLEWAARFERLANRLAHINPLMQVAAPGKPGTVIAIYGSVFADPKFRTRLELYVVQKNSGGTELAARHPLPHELRSGDLRDTVAKAEERIADFQRSNSWGIDLEYYLRG